MSSNLHQQQQPSTPPEVDALTSSPGEMVPPTSDFHAMEVSHVNSQQSDRSMVVIPKALESNEANEESMSISESIVSSVLTADGIHDFPGFLCVCLVILLGDMSRGVMFPSMWPLVQKLGGDQVTLGYSVAAFSFGRVLVNPFFGSMSHTHGYSDTLLLSTSILLLGTILYSQVQTVMNPQFLIFAQTCLGVGSGTLGVTRAFVADVTAKRNRTTYMAWITAVQYGGFTVTPFIGSFFIWAFNGREYNLGPLRLDQFTAPAYFMSVVCMLTLVVLLVFFRHRQRISIKKSSKKSAKQAARDEFANTTTFIGLTIYDCCILGCFLLNIATKGSIASFETMGVAIAQNHFNMSSSRAGLIVSICGAIGVRLLLWMGYFEKYFSDVQLIAGGMAVMGLGIAILMPIKGQMENPGWEYFLAMLMIYGVGYPIGHTAVIGLFSKSK